MIYELKYGQTWKIWQSSLNFSFYNTFNAAFQYAKTYGGGQKVFVKF